MHGSKLREIFAQRCFKEFLNQLFHWQVCVKIKKNCLNIDDTELDLNKLLDNYINCLKNNLHFESTIALSFGLVCV